jgi:hypothetical protein
MPVQIARLAGARVAAGHARAEDLTHDLPRRVATHRLRPPRRRREAAYLGQGRRRRCARTVPPADRPSPGPSCSCARTGTWSPTPTPVETGGGHRDAQSESAGLLHVQARLVRARMARARERQRAILEQAAGHVDAGQVRVAARGLPRERAASAYRALQAGQILGKASPDHAVTGPAARPASGASLAGIAPPAQNRPALSTVLIAGVKSHDYPASPACPGSSQAPDPGRWPRSCAVVLARADPDRGVGFLAAGTMPLRAYAPGDP